MNDPSRTETILVAEDDEDLLEIMTLSLEDEAYEIMRRTTAAKRWSTFACGCRISSCWT